MLTLREYIEQVRTKHEIKVKIARPVMDEEFDKIEQHLEKYDVERVSTPEKTILQTRPLDFPSIEQAEVTVFTFVANLPVSLDKLRVELASLLNCLEGHIVVRNTKDPRETQDSQTAELDKEEHTALLGTEYSEKELVDAAVKQEELVGDKYNTSLLKELKKLADERNKDMPKVKDSEVKESSPEIGDGTSTNKTSPLSKPTRK